MFLGLKAGSMGTDTPFIIIKSNVEMVPQHTQGLSLSRKDDLLNLSDNIIV